MRKRFAVTLDEEIVSNYKRVSSSLGMAPSSMGYAIDSVLIEVTAMLEKAKGSGTLTYFDFIHHMADRLENLVMSGGETDDAISTPTEGERTDN